MGKYKVVPNIRFEGFDAEWERSELKRIAKIVGGGTPDTNNSNYWNGNINWFSPNEIGKYPYVYSSYKKITNLGLKKSSAKLHPSEKTILFTSRAGIGDMAILKTEAATNQGFQSLELKDNIYPYFVYSYGFKIKKEAYKLASGSTFLEISKKDMEKINLWFPAKKEQKKIGYLFTKLDKLLDLQKQKIEKLELLKKSLLQKLFPKHDTKIPELRFKVYKDNWESKKFKNILNYERPDKYIVKSDNYSNNGIPVLTANKSFILGYTQEPNFYEKSLPVIIFDDFTLDCKLVNFPFKIKSSAIKILSPNNFSDIWFDFYLLKVTYFIKEGHARHYISIVQSKITNVPGKAEQQKIGNLLSKVDQLIELENKKLENLQQFKKCLLQNMFVE